MHQRSTSSPGLAKILGSVLLLGILLSACLPTSGPQFPQVPVETIPATSIPIPITERPVYAPGELVDYTVQSGDTLSNLAFRFNTTIQEILEENPVIPEDATTLPPGLPMQIPIYYESLWGPQYQVLPNCSFVNGPAQIDFNLEEFPALISGLNPSAVVLPVSAKTQDGLDRWISWIEDTFPGISHADS